MNNASIRTPSAEPNRDAIGPSTTRVCGDGRADNRLRPAVEGMRRGPAIAPPVRDIHPRDFGPPASVEHVASETHHGKC